MNLETTFLHSKLARRTFWLFTLCALLPITVLAVISLRNVTNQLREQNLRELRQLSRDEAMSIYGRLIFLEANLKLAALTVPGTSAKSSSPTSSTIRGLLSELAGRFDALELVTPDGNHQSLYGKEHRPIEYTAGEQEFLRSGHSVLSTIPCDMPDLCIFLSTVLDVDSPGDGLLVGEIRPSYLWDAENIRAPTLLSVINPSGRVLFCSGETPDRLPGRVFGGFSGEFEWQARQQTYLASYWSLPLHPLFFSTHWTIISSEAKPDVVAPLNRFRASFLLVFLLTLWIVVFLSLVQIRRYLGPLGKLKEGTRGISSGDFQTRVAISSGDEFEELASSFNSMAGRIEKQVHALKVVNEIDGAILSAWDTTKVVDTVCSRFRDLIPHDMVCVNLFDLKDSLTLLTHVFLPGSENPEHTETTPLTPQCLAELCDRREVSVLANHDAQPSYLGPLLTRGMKHFLIIPVLSDNGPSAVFSLGLATASVWNDEDKERARHLADQISVAFSNSQLVADLKQLQWGTLTALARAIDAKSPWTLGHSERVTTWAIKIAAALGLPPLELDIMRRGGLLHDIGKIATPAEILDKPGKLTDEEMKIMREHVNAGARILEPIPGLAESMPIVLQHHEWLNGGGYPNGIAGEEITLHARIFAVADCFDALISDRPYRAGLPLERVVQIIQDGAAKQFDPNVIQVLRRLLEQETAVQGSKENSASLSEVGRSGVPARL
jgi:putative nucleotidyltransferase with HDIG domain